MKLNRENLTSVWETAVSRKPYILVHRKQSGAFVQRERDAYIIGISENGMFKSVRGQLSVGSLDRYSLLICSNILVCPYILAVPLVVEIY